ncbi:MAG: dihydrolipoamide acetyltransferase family protein [Bacteroidetes bacterium]|nr:dihydrolipoamide acetyltransferase family protein [Bacteroidota bacterium]
MANFEIVMPQMGEGLIEATLTKWLKQEGDAIAEDDALVEVATDKVDTEIPSPVSGTLVKKLFAEGDVVPIGKAIALVEMKSERASTPVVAVTAQPAETAQPVLPVQDYSGGTRFYSPLVKSIAKQEHVSMKELSNIPGTGKDDRVTKEDILNWVKTRKSADRPVPLPAQTIVNAVGDEIVEMDRIRQLISSHMSKSWETSPHVNSFMEVDMTRIANWRSKNKDSFEKRENIKLTFTPVIIESIAKAVRDVPQVNVSIDGTRIICHKNINIGMAVSLPNNGLIVPVIKNADQKSLTGMVRSITDLADRARKNKLIPDEISGGTISLTNLGSFGLLAGTPIINQPQTAIVAVGVIKKRPVVLETPDGDTIAIRHMMILSVAHDHRVIDGVLAGQFLDRMRFYLENYDVTQSI